MGSFTNHRARGFFDDAIKLQLISYHSRRYEREVDQKSEELSGLKGSKANILLKLQELTLKVMTVRFSIVYLMCFVDTGSLPNNWMYSKIINS